MEDNENIKIEVWDDDGFIELTAEEKRLIATDKPVWLEEITDEIETKKPEAPYTKRGNKKYYKTETSYIYKIDDRQYVYRLFLKKTAKPLQIDIMIATPKPKNLYELKKKRKRLWIFTST